MTMTKTRLKPGTSTTISYSIRCNSSAEVQAARLVGAVPDLADDLVSCWRFTPEQKALWMQMGGD